MSVRDLKIEKSAALNVESSGNYRVIWDNQWTSSIIHGWFCYDFTENDETSSIHGSSLALFVQCLLKYWVHQDPYVGFLGFISIAMAALTPWPHHRCLKDPYVIPHFPTWQQWRFKVTGWVFSGTSENQNFPSDFWCSREIRFFFSTGLNLTPIHPSKKRPPNGPAAELGETPWISWNRIFPHEVPWRFLVGDVQKTCETAIFWQKTHVFLSVLWPSSNGDSHHGPILCSPKKLMAKY